MSADNSLVLLTGATGFVGANILHSLLTSHYRVIAPIRPSSISKAEFFTKKYSHLPAGTLQFVKVSDQTSASQFIPHLNGVSAIIHTASVIPDFSKPLEDVEVQYINPVTDMVAALFEAALEVKTVKRFVFTSSSTAVFETLDLSRKEYTEGDWNPITLEEVLVDNDPGKTYSASKTFAEQRLWELTKEKKPAFEVVILCPPMILGESHHETNGLEGLGGSAAPLLRSMVDSKDIPWNPYPQFVNASDCAEAHIAGAFAPLVPTPGVPHRYLISSGTLSYHRLIPALLKRYPQLVGRLPTADPEKAGEVFPPFSTEKAERDLGLKFARGWEESIVEKLWGDLIKYL